MSLSHSVQSYISELSPVVSEITVVNLFPRNSGDLLDQRGVVVGGGVYHMTWGSVPHEGGGVRGQYI